MSNIDFKNKIWWTKKSRIKAEERLLSTAFHAQMIVFWYSFFSVAVSIFYLKIPSDSQQSAVAWVIFSVLGLCASSFLNGMNHKERASLIKECYEKLNEIYIKADDSRYSQDELDREYISALNACENHLEIDYVRALCQEYLFYFPNNQHQTKKPSYYTFYLYISYWAIYRFSLLVFYFLPFILLFFIR